MLNFRTSVDELLSQTPEAALQDNTLDQGTRSVPNNFINNIDTLSLVNILYQLGKILQFSWQRLYCPELEGGLVIGSVYCQFLSRIWQGTGIVLTRTNSRDNENLSISIHLSSYSLYSMFLLCLIYGWKIEFINFVLMVLRLTVSIIKKYKIKRTFQCSYEF